MEVEMEMQKNIRYMCRICTVDVKKRRASNGPVTIFQIPQLAEKLRRYLYIEIDPNDELPKRLCGNCYRRVESCHSFANLANKTEKFLKKFISFEKDKALKQQQLETQCNAFALSNIETITTDRTAPGIGEGTTINDAGEVVVNVSVNNPLTRNMENKIGFDLTSVIKRCNNDQQSSSSTCTATLGKEAITAIGPTAISSEVKVQQKQQEISEQPSTMNVKRKSKSSSRNMSKSQNISKSQNNRRQEERLRDVKLHKNKIQVAQDKLPSLPPLLPINNNNSSSSVAAPSTITAETGSLISNDDTKMLTKRLQEITNRAPYESPNLGCVIKDMDLLKLILKALKWHFTDDTLQTQIQRLKDTPLRDVITDPNLLQDTDMTQLLRSYLSPILLQTQISGNTNSSSSALSTLSTLAAHLLATSPSAPSLPPQIPPSSTSSTSGTNPLASIASYKIPADTSVQLISVPLSERNAANYNQQHHHFHHHQFQSQLLQQQQQQRYQEVTIKTKTCPQKIPSSPIVLSDDSNDNNVQKFEVNVDPALYFPGEKEFYFHQYNNTEFAGLLKKHPKSVTDDGKAKSRRRRKKSPHKLRLDVYNKQQDNQIQSNQQQQPSSLQELQTESLACINQLPKKPKVIRDEGFKDFDIDSVTLIEEQDEGDDEVWAQFKVTDSPDTNEADIENHNKELNSVKKEIVDDMEISTTPVPIVENIQNEVVIKEEEENENIIETVAEISKENTAEAKIDTKTDANIETINNTTTTIKPKTERGRRRKQTLPIVTQITVPEIIVESKKEVDTIKEIKENKKDEEQAPKQEITSKANEFINEELPISQIKSLGKKRKRGDSKEPSTSNERVTRSRSPKKNSNRRKLISKKIDNEISRSPSSNKRESQSRSTTVEKKESTSPSPPTIGRTTRKRICKQCGLTFYNITDFMDHRKKHM